MINSTTLNEVHYALDTMFEYSLSFFLGAEQSVE
jgi:hypothetical protein